MGFKPGRHSDGDPPSRRGPDVPSPKRACACLPLIVALACAVAYTPCALGTGRPQTTDRLIVTLKPTAATAGIQGLTVDALQGMSIAAGTPLKRVHRGDGRQVLSLPGRLPLSQVESIARRLRSDPRVQYAEPDRPIYPSAVPDDPDYSRQWHYRGPGAGEPGGADLPGAWSQTTGAPAVVIAVLDTGILPHQDLAGRALAGYDFISDARTANDGDGRDGDPADPGDWITAEESAGTDATGGYFSGCAVTDSTWHGTHVAGTLAAVTNNNLGVAGVNWTSKLLPLRVLGKCGGYTSDIVDAIRWAAGLTVAGVPANTHPARVINLSLSGAGPCGQAEQQAIDDATAAGSIVVVAAGNDDKDAGQYHPGNCRGVITVAADNRAGGKASYSNYGSAVAISAPGGEVSGIFSTLDRGTRGPLNDNSYGYYIGTSMATAHVAGTVSLMLSANHALTHAMLSPATVLAKLQAAARPFPTGTGDDCDPSRCGAGLLDGADAVRDVSTSPSANAGDDQVVEAGSQVTLDGGASSAPYGAIAKYRWSQSAGTPVTIINSDAPSAAFVAPGSAGALTFTLTVVDDSGLTSSDNVTVTVTGGTLGPVADDQQIQLEEDGGYTGMLYASDPAGTGLGYSIVNNGVKGRAVITDAATGQFTYTPFPNANGRDSFTFRARGGGAQSNIATVVVDIRPVNDPPVAVGATVAAAPGRPFGGQLTGGDVDGNALTYSVVTGPAKGTVAVTPGTGHFVYTPATDAAGTDTFTYRVFDGSAYSPSATVTVNITGTVDSPVLVSHGVNGLVMAEGATVRVPFDALDPDVADGDHDTYGVTPAGLGRAAFAGNVLTYTATAPGTELLTVTVADASGNTDAVVLPVTVNTADAPDSNQDGLSDAQAVAAGLDPQAAGGDTDGDGIGDALEVGNPLAPTDRDGDHVIDALEYGAAARDPARLVFVVCPPTAARLGLDRLAGGIVSIEADQGAALLGRVNGGYGIPLYDQASAAAGDGGYGYPFGLVDYSVRTAASRVKVVVTLPAGVALPSNAVVRKQDGGGRWVTLPAAVLDRKHNTVTLTLADNDGFDGDPAAGVIRDPVGVAVALPASASTGAPSSAGAQGGAGGGGVLDPLSAAMTLAPLWRRRRRERRVSAGSAGCRSGPWPGRARRRRR